MTLRNMQRFTFGGKPMRNYQPTLQFCYISGMFYPLLSHSFALTTCKLTVLVVTCFYNPRSAASPAANSRQLAGEKTRNGE